MIKRIINKQTGMFLRDDFTFDEKTEIGLEVNPAQGLYQPKWDGEKWIEGLTAEEIAQQEAMQNITIPYEQHVIELIRQKYSLDEELAIQRQRDAKPIEFQQYFDYCEQCKIAAKN